MSHCLRLGAVVERENPRYGGHERGVVTSVPGQSDWHKIWLDDWSIDITGHGPSKICGGGEGWAEEWTLVPEDQQTASERVLAVQVAWSPPDWLDPGDDPSDCDTFPWACIVALIGPKFREEWEDGDWPSSVGELSIWAARYLDRQREESPDVHAR